MPDEQTNFVLISSLSSFRTFLIFGYKCKIRSKWNLVHIKGSITCIFVPILVGNWWRFTELKSIIYIKGLLCLQVKHWKELPCRWSNHHKSAFLWFERNQDKDYRDMIQNPTGIKITWSNLRIQIQQLWGVNWKLVCF